MLALLSSFFFVFLQALREAHAVDYTLGKHTELISEFYVPTFLLSELLT